MILPNAENLNYWKTSKTSPDSWIDKAIREIEKVGGEITAYYFAHTPEFGAAYRLDFTFEIDNFRAIWPVLPSKNDDNKAAKIQAATMLYHDIKGRMIAVKVFGFRYAFLNFYILPNGKPLSALGNDEIQDHIIKLLP